MSLSILMKKEIADSNIVLYKVSDYLHSLDFLVAVKLSSKEVLFFKSAQDYPKKSLITLGELGPDSIMPRIPGIDRAVSNWIIAQIYKAFIKNNFPDTLSFASL